RTAVTEISIIGRATQGVRAHKLHEGDRVTSIAKVIPEVNGVGEKAEGTEAPEGTESSDGHEGGEQPEA
ncbi:MAG: DNA gyrase C-terminal beta-propeller domain-containing protein, partial [Chlamydiota bacterium]